MSTTTMGVQPQRSGEVRANNNWLGLAVFLASYALVFALLVMVYLYFRFRAPVWPPAGLPRLDPVLPGLNVLVLIAAALSTSWAEASIRRVRWAGLRLGLTATIVLGVVFSAIQAFELSRVGFTAYDGTYGATFFTLTVFHALHVVVGVLWAGIVLARATRGYVAPERPFPVQATVLYWYFIAAAWVIMFAVLYLW